MVLMLPKTAGTLVKLLLDKSKLEIYFKAPNPVGEASISTTLLSQASKISRLANS